MTNTFSGIRFGDAPWFIAAQIAGAFTATLLFRWLLPHLETSASAVLAPPDQP